MYISGFYNDDSKFNEAEKQGRYGFCNSDGVCSWYIVRKDVFEAELDTSIWFVPYHDEKYVYVISCCYGDSEDSLLYKELQDLGYVLIATKRSSIFIILTNEPIDESQNEIFRDYNPMHVGGYMELIDIECLTEDSEGEESSD